MVMSPRARRINHSGIACKAYEPAVTLLKPVTGEHPRTPIRLPGGQVVAGSNPVSRTKLKQFRGGFGAVRDRLFSYLPGCVRQPA